MARRRNRKRLADRYSINTAAGALAIGAAKLWRRSLSHARGARRDRQADLNRKYQSARLLHAANNRATLSPTPTPPQKAFAPRQRRETKTTSLTMERSYNHKTAEETLDRVAFHCVSLSLSMHTTLLGRKQINIYIYICLASFVTARVSGRVSLYRFGGERPL